MNLSTGQILVEADIKEKGRGLNSIPVRFALMTFVLCSVALAIQFYGILPEPPVLDWQHFALIALTLCLPTAVTYFAARKLAGMIGALRNSTLAILEGEINSPVDVDCECEVGGLADSFRAMVARLNSNILRMNILAYTDNVTGLPNRAVINHVLDLAREKGPENCRGAMFFIDLDGFKRINDTYGHDVGDELLRLSSQRIIRVGFGENPDELDNCTTAFGELCQTCPESLVFSRFAGDEFVALLPGERSEEELKFIGEAIVASLQEPFEVFGNDITIGASIGVATVNEALRDPRDLLIHSDIAMYRAKETGRNRVVFFDVDLKARVAERNELENDLREAIESDELTLHYQPKICARTHQLMGVEALARWVHPSKGAVSPDIFIPIAEQSGSMAMLGQTVLRLVAAQANNWGATADSLPIAVNVSPVQFESPDLVVSILQILERANIDPSLLELELTESLAMSDYASTKRRLEALRNVGIRVAIDDFGTGYSNLSQLARLNFDTLKIDRSLVSGIGTNEKAEAMLHATINMAHALGHQVVAEGIENEMQMKALRELGCDQFQGFYVAHPMNASDLNAWNKARQANGVGRMLAEAEARIAAAG